MTHQELHRVENLTEVPIKAFSIMPRGWWSRMLLRLARWKYRIEFDGDIK